MKEILLLQFPCSNSLSLQHAHKSRQPLLSQVLLISLYDLTPPGATITLQSV